MYEISATRSHMRTGHMSMMVTSWVVPSSEEGSVVTGVLSVQLVAVLSNTPKSITFRRVFFILFDFE